MKKWAINYDSPTRRRRIAHELLHDKLCPEDASPSLVASRAELASELLAILSDDQVSRAVAVLREWA